LPDGIVKSRVRGYQLATAARDCFQCLKDDKSDDDLKTPGDVSAGNLTTRLKIIIRNETLTSRVGRPQCARRLKLNPTRIEPRRPTTSENK